MRLDIYLPSRIAEVTIEPCTHIVIIQSTIIIAYLGRESAAADTRALGSGGLVEVLEIVGHVAITTIRRRKQLRIFCADLSNRVRKWLQIFPSSTASMSTIEEERRGRQSVVLISVQVRAGTCLLLSCLERAALRSRRPTAHSPSPTRTFRSGVVVSDD